MILSFWVSSWGSSGLQQHTLVVLFFEPMLLMSGRLSVILVVSMYFVSKSLANGHFSLCSLYFSPAAEHLQFYPALLGICAL